jgi:hypothetical protein
VPLTCCCTTDTLPDLLLHKPAAARAQAHPC